MVLSLIPFGSVSAQEAVPAPELSSRFGVVNSGPTDAESVGKMLGSLGAGSWFSFGGLLEKSGSQVGLVRPGANLADIARQAAAAPGATWLVGNEPNVPGQDDLEPARFAAFVAESTDTILAADPTATFVGPNTLNWETTCGGCGGFATGRAWSDEFLAVYRDRYGEPPFRAWGLHLYNLNWTSLPLIDPATDRKELELAREWLISEGLDLPIWVSEFGIVWAYPGLETVRQSDGRFLLEPRGEYQTDRVREYLNTMFAWLTGPASCQGVTRWFLYSTDPPPEPFATVVAGISLLDRSTEELTEFGEVFRNWATRTELPSPECGA
jgi:hypothetical protein